VNAVRPAKPISTHAPRRRSGARSERGSTRAAAQTAAPISITPTSVHVVRSSWEPPRETNAVPAITSATPTVTAGPAGGSGIGADCRRRRSAPGGAT
jgi:hypothetical protein